MSVEKIAILKKAIVAYLKLPGKKNDNREES
jgi:hypothetical protein